MRSKIALGWRKGNFGWAALNSDEESVKAHQESVGKVITHLEIEENPKTDFYDIANRLIFTLEDNSKLALFDDGQSCCEIRYMHTDDDLGSFLGAIFQDVEIRDGATKENEWDTIESQFLIVSTSKGQFTVVNYNEHNGYYGGFAIEARII